MNKFSATGLKRRKLLKMRVSQFSDKSRRIRSIAIKSLFAVLGLGALFVAVMVLLEMLESGDFDAIYIGSIIMSAFIGLMLVWLAMPNKDAAEIPHWIKRLEKRGGIEAALQEIHSNVKDGSPVYYVQGNKGQVLAGAVGGALLGGGAVLEVTFFVVGNWWINNAEDKDTCEIIHISEIAAIKGDTEYGTNAVLTDGTITSTMFGQRQWKEVFDLFISANPYILYTDEEITLSDGRTVDICTAVNEVFDEKNVELTKEPHKNIQAIISEYEKKCKIGESKKELVTSIF